MEGLHKPVMTMIWPAFAAVLLAAMYALISDATFTWLALLSFSAIAAGGMALSRDKQETLLFLFALTVPINISKTLVAESAIYAPTLSLFPSDLILIAVLLFLLFDVALVQRRTLRFDHVHRIVFIFVAWLWMRGLFSEQTFIGFLGALIYTKFFLLYYLLTIRIQQPRDLKVFLYGWFAGFFIQVPYVAAQFVTGSKLEIQGAKSTDTGVQLVFEQAGGLSAFRPSGFLQHPNVMADFLTFTLPLALVFVLLGKKRLSGGIWHVALLVLLIGTAMLIVTLSRGGWIAFAAAVAVIAIAGIRKGLVKSSHIAGLVSLALAGTLVVAAVYPQALLRLTESDQRSTESRFAMMDQAWLIIRNQPLLGVGMSGYNAAAQRNIPESFSHLDVPFQQQLLKGIVHNFYFLLTAQTGFIGLALYLYMVFCVLRLSPHLLRSNDIAVRALALGLSAAIFAQIVFQAFDHFDADMRHEMQFIFFGLLHSLALLEHRRLLTSHATK